MDQAMDQPSTTTETAKPDSMGSDEASRLKDLTADVRDQDDLERDVNRQADQLLTEQANERDQKRLEKTQTDKERLRNQVSRLQQRRARIQDAGSASSIRIENEISNLQAQVRQLDVDSEQITERIRQRHEEVPGEGEAPETSGGNRRLPHESQRDFLIRTGKITPFSKLPGRNLDRADSSLQNVLLAAEEEESDREELGGTVEGDSQLPKSHRNLTQPGFADETESVDGQQSGRPRKRRRVETDRVKLEDESSVETRNSSFSPETDAQQLSGPETPLESDDGDSEDPYGVGRPASTRASSIIAVRKDDLASVDDGDERLYQRRLRQWAERRRLARQRNAKDITDPKTTGTEDDNEANEASPMTADECFQAHPTKDDTTLEGGFRVPGDVYPSLFDYQKTGLQWLCELYFQQVGGIVGDEMGLGKTIQVISFLASLHYSKRLTKPVIIVAPATVMKQWVNEFHTWWPPLRVSILHTSGSGMLDVGREQREEEDLLSRLPSATGSKSQSKSQKQAKKIVDRVVRDGHILVTTYSGLQSYADLLIPIDWEYAVLDEGHKIRNPNTAITIYCKELRTVNRIILSGTPMQNNLVELWSLFDFIFPMRLGTLVTFRQQFEIPIRQGGYANASNLQVQTAMKCAETLKDAISPYLLQRFKADVATDLPQKSEQVLFCKLTRQQREAYEGFLDSDELKAIMNGKRQILYGVDILRKICNHPDLVEHKTLSLNLGYDYGNATKSGKMQVVKALLELWLEQGHKTLLFAQHRIMLDILEKSVRSMAGLRYRRMDGTTTISARQGLVDDFNTNPNVHVFLLTTKVGGLGVNLTGADRVIIFDPDWNPSTDVQARERAWRLGQKRDVMIYRLMTAGTIEEKIYHRQLFKQFLINKILRDPKQRQTFQMKDLHDLFTLGGANDSSTETGSIFKEAEINLNHGSTESTILDGANLNPEHRSAEQADETASIGGLKGVAHMERFRGDKAKEKQKGVEVTETNSNSRVMEGIFARSGVHAALEHDAIVNGKKVVRADPLILEREAKRVAAAAAKELKKAGEAARSVPIGTPTWTGEFGSAGRPEQQPQPRALGRGRGRGGPSSASILAGLQNRQAGLGTPAGSNASRSSTPGSTTTGLRGVDFMKMLQEFLLAHGGSAYSQMLVQHFDRYCKSPARTAEFKAMLTEIATLQKGTGGRGRWFLKPEYKTG